MNSFYTYTSKIIGKDFYETILNELSNLSNFNDFKVKDDWDVVEETDNQLKLSLDLPGIDKSKLELFIIQNGIKVLAERNDKKIEKKFIWKYEIDDVKASYVDGVLTITATPVSKTNTRKIEIDTGG